MTEFTPEKAADLFRQSPFETAFAEAIPMFCDDQLWHFQDAEDVRYCTATLMRAGAADLAFGRLFEGHVNALQLVARYGTTDQVERLRNMVDAGARLGVWNSDCPGNGVIWDGHQLTGAKNFASGAGLLSHALVTSDANCPDKCQMHLVELEGSDMDIDRTWWNPLGMRRTESHIVRWTSLPNDRFEQIGQVGDYQKQPFFSAGALRFVAVQTGALAQLYVCLRKELIQRSRASHPQQQRRLSEAFMAAQTAVDTVLGVAMRYDEKDHSLPQRVTAARLTVMALAEAQITRVQRAVGMSAMQASSPLFRPLTDLMTYLCQPDPDGASASLGSAMPDIAL